VLTIDLFDDAVGIGSPEERFGFAVVLDEIAVSLAGNTRDFAVLPQPVKFGHRPAQQGGARRTDTAYRGRAFRDAVKGGEHG
jgi:hypothetical protein